MTYWMWLAVLSAIFVALERLWPRDRAQGFLRPGLATDVFYAVFDGHYLGVLMALATEPLSRALDAWLASAGLSIHLRVASGWPFAVQLAVALVVTDFMQWSIHNLLHRVPALWELHKVHHSIRHMDFWGSLRFHFGEIVVYKSLQYVPLALLGFDGRALFVLAVISTAIGHLNHSNLRLRMGWLKYLINGPEMHVWHHAHPKSGVPSPNVNFAINLAIWDWLFGTAYLPARDASGAYPPPSELGFPGIESFPGDPLRQELWPLTRRRATAGAIAETTTTTTSTTTT